MIFQRRSKMKMEPEKYKKVKTRAVRPVLKPDGTWTTIIEESEEMVPDLGREKTICNVCGWSTYPKCKEWCHIIKRRES